MLIITNRKINKLSVDGKIGDENTFGDELDKNEEDQQILKIAKANKIKAGWKVELTGEIHGSKNDSNVVIPSFESQYIALRNKLVKEEKNCVFFVHGFNQTFKKNLEKCLDIEKLHSVEVIAFSWPSNSKEHFSCDEYKGVRDRAMESAIALNSVFTELNNYPTKLVKNTNLFNSKISFLAFSLGNYLFQKSIDRYGSSTQPNLFDNVILCQADVKRDGHENWCDKINVGRRVYATINENDNILRTASHCESYFRLGESAKNLNCNNMIYIDFTHGQYIERNHELFRFSQNKYAKSFFTNVLNGYDVEGTETFDLSFKYFEKPNCYKYRKGYRDEPSFEQK